MLEIDLGQGVKFAIERVDEMNLTVYKWRDVKKKDGTTKKEWVATRTYYQRIPQACRAICDMIAMDKVENAGSLTKYLCEMREITGKIEEAMRLAE